MNNDYLEVNICDVCLVERSRHITYVTAKNNEEYSDNPYILDDKTVKCVREAAKHHMLYDNYEVRLRNGDSFKFDETMARMDDNGLPVLANDEVFQLHENVEFTSSRGIKYRVVCILPRESGASIISDDDRILMLFEEV